MMGTQSIVVNGQESADQAPQLNKGNIMSSNTLSGKDWNLFSNKATGRACSIGTKVVDDNYLLGDGYPAPDVADVVQWAPKAVAQERPIAVTGDCLTIVVHSGTKYERAGVARKREYTRTVFYRPRKGFWGKHGFNSKHVSYNDIIEQQEEFAAIPGYSINSIRGR